MRHTLLTLVLFCCLSTLAFAKGSASLSGKITDATGQPLANVSIRLQNEKVGTAANVLKTAADGSFSFAKLDSGAYTALATIEGFESRRFTAISIGSAADNFLLDIQLQKAGSWGSSILSRRYEERREIVDPTPDINYSTGVEGNSAIKGTLGDEKGKPIVNANVLVTEGGIQKGRDLTDFDGKYTIRPINGGRYNVKFSFLGRDLTMTNVIVAADQSVTVNAKLSTTSEAIKGGKGVEVHAVRVYTAPIIDPENPGGRTVKADYEIERAPTRSTSDIAALSTEVYSSGSSAGLSIGGGRSSSTKYVVHGATSTISPREMRKIPAAAGDAAAYGYASSTSSGASGIVAMAAPETHAGSLTSGEINDFSKWTLWEDLSMETLKAYRTAWPFRPEARYTVLVKSKTGMPLCNARVKMSDGSGQIWEALTDNTGKAELWYGMWNSASTTAPVLSASVEYGSEHFSIPVLKPFAEGANILATNLSCLNPAKLDIAFVVDATGSMGDEINYLKAELRDILQKVHDSMPATQVQTGALFYRDLSDTYLTRISDLTPDFNKTEAFIADNSADGGGDTPEAVDAALEEALNAFHWRTDATARLAFLVLDAPPHNDAATVKRMQDLTTQYAARGIRLIPVVCSGSDKPTEYLMRSLALATNGTYLFLTDHSGIGGSHTAPTTDKYDVEYLNGLIYRVIYQCAYMPSCTEGTARHSDTAKVQQQADSVTISWRYYPNPTTGLLYIAHTHTAGYLFITDITGKAILRVPADASGTTMIDLRQYPDGIYSIRYNWADDKWVSGKFVLMH